MSSEIPNSETAPTAQDFYTWTYTEQTTDYHEFTQLYGQGDSRLRIPNPAYVKGAKDAKEPQYVCTLQLATTSLQS